MHEEKRPVADMLSRLDIEELNEMQTAMVAAAQEHEQIILLSDTGTGKTVAYLLPLVRLLDHTKPQSQALIVVPSRELALQIESVFKKMSTSLSISCCYGGHRRETEEQNLSHNPQVIVGTPGRLADHLRRKNIDVTGIQLLVLDEYDKSLELGFTDEISFIATSLSGARRKFLVSATIAADIPTFLALQNAVTLNFLSANPAPALAIQIVKSPDRDKLHTLHSFLCFTSARPSIVFCNHRESVERVSEYLSEHSITNVFYHGAMEQYDRELALCKFRNGTATILVTTDLAARGLDVPHIRYIIHYHLPATPESFTHRNGRTARMDTSGTAVLIIGPDETLAFEIPDAEEIELPEELEIPPRPKWSTLFIAAGKKDKVNKVDIVGFLSNKAQLKREDLGLIEVHDHLSYAAIRKSSMSMVLQKIKNEKIKNKKVKMDIAR